MEDGFPLLEEFQDEHTLERQLESLLDDASHHLPDLDTGVLGDGSHVPSSVDGLDVLDQDIFDNPRTHASYSLPSPGGPMLTHMPSHSYRQSSSPHSVHASPAHYSVPPSPQVPPSPHQVPPSPHQVPPSPHQVPPSPHPMQSPASVPPSPAQHTFQAPSPPQPPSPAIYSLPMKSPVNLPPPPSPANIYYSKSPAAYAPPKSPVSSRPTHTPGPPILSPQPVAVSQNSLIFSAPSPNHSGQVISGTNLVPGTVFTGNQLGMQQLQLHPNGTIMSGGGQVFQIQFQQPNVSMHGMVSTAAKSQPLVQSISNNKVKQPQLLPKPSLNVSQQSGGGGVRVSSNIVSAAPTPSSVQQQQPIFINQGGVISSVQAAGGAGQIIMGQMMTPNGPQATPMIIQQSSGGQMFVLRPNAPSIQTAQTIVPIAAQPGQLAGQLILQQGQPRGILGNQQVKLLPQNQMQMQQIQTPSGPKLIAVPFGQTLMAANNLIAAPASSGGMQFAQGLSGTGQIQFQTAPMTVVSSAGFSFQTTPSTQTSVTSLPMSIKTTSVLHHSSGGTITSVVPSPHPDTNSMGTNPNSVIQSNKHFEPSALSPNKKKKSKKKKRDLDEDVAPHPKSGTVDLGALMKDVGLDLDDLDSFNMDGSSSLEGSGGFSHMPLTLNTSQESTSSSEPENLMPNLAYVNPGDIVQSSQPPQLTGHIQVSQSQGLVAPTLKPALVQPTPPVRMTAPSMMTPPLSAGSSFQLIQGADGQFILQPSAAPPATSQPEPPATPVSVLESRPPAITPPRASPRSAAKPRQPADPNRTPLMEDETLPPGWHRKVSQRKSGASAGRYEVFIIGPTGKRFRSRNELKSFFEKTGEGTLNPDDFDFSTFGRNNPKAFSSGSGFSHSTPTHQPVVNNPPTAFQQLTTATTTTSSSINLPQHPTISLPHPSVTLPQQQPPLSLHNQHQSISLPQHPTISLPQHPTLSLPQHPTISLPQNPTLSLPQHPSISLPQHPTLSLPQHPTLSLPQHPTISLPQHPTISLPQHPTISLPQHPSVSLPQHPTTSVISSSYSTPQVVGSAPPTGLTSNPHLSSNSETELIKKLEVTGMASVAAARASETWVQGLGSRNNLLKNIQQPLPQSALVSPPSLDLPRAPPQLDLHSLGLSPSSLEDADEQISKLLKNLHQQPGAKQEDHKPPPPHIFDPSRRTKVRSGSLKSPEPPVITSVKSAIAKSSSSLFNDNVPSPSMPVLLPQVPITSDKAPEASGFQNSYLDSLAKSQIGDKRGHRTRNSSGLSLSSPATASRMPMLSPSLNKSSDPHNPSLQQHKPTTVIHQNPRFEASSSGPPNVTIQTSLAAPTGMGGAGSQIRAMQNAPANTRLVRGPNGQVTLQKVQTIELSQEMQHEFKLVAQRISDIESKSVKTPQDEAVLASLQAKQHQILSTGRPVNTQPQQQLSQPHQPVSQAHHPASMSHHPVTQSHHPQLHGAPPRLPHQSLQTIRSQPPHQTPAVSHSSGLTTHPSSQIRLQPPANLQPHPPSSLQPHPPSNLQSHPPPVLQPHPPSNLQPHPHSNLQPHPPSNLQPHPPPKLQSHPPPSLQPHLSSNLHPHPSSSLQPHLSSQVSSRTMGLTPAKSNLMVRHPLQSLGGQAVHNPQIHPFVHNNISAIQGSGESRTIIQHSLKPGPPHSVLDNNSSPFPPHLHPNKVPPPPAPSSVIPPLTDLQKKIVAEFKSRIANLPPDQQQAFITQNKRNLLYKLNFQPSQLHVLQGARPPPPPPGPLRPIHPHMEQPRPQLMHIPPGLQPNHMPIRPLSMHQDNIVVLPPPGGLEFPSPRPANLPPINKAKKIAWVESQIKKDQHEAVNPNYRTPFRSKEDACKRLLRYHVFDEPSLTLEDWNQSEENFEKKSVSLLGKYHSMMSKYHILLLQESTRLCSSSEEVMLARHWESDERDTLRKEKEEHARISNRIADLQAKTKLEVNEVDELDTLLEQADPTFPPLPPSWESKYEQIVGKPYEAANARKAHIKHKVFSRKTEKVEKFEQVRKVETLKPLTPVPEVEIKREPDIAAEMPVLEDERLFRYSDLKTSARSRNSSQASLDSFRSFRSRNDSGASRKELRVSLTNVLSSPQFKESPHFKKEHQDTGSIVSSSSRPQSACSSPDPAGAFVGLKFNRTTSGRWSASLKRDLEEGESADDVATPPPGWKKSRLSPTFGSDSDDDFSLADVGGEAAVRSMLEQEDEEEGTARDIRFYSHANLFGNSGGGGLRGTPTSETGDNDSVQNAINSILDMHDRGGMQTPDDLNNLTGLLDSMEEDDPNLDAAVKSIQGLL